MHNCIMTICIIGGSHKQHQAQKKQNNKNNKTQKTSRKQEAVIFQVEQLEGLDAAPAPSPCNTIIGNENKHNQEQHHKQQHKQHACEAVWRHKHDNANNNNQEQEPQATRTTISNKSRTRVHGRVSFCSSTVALWGGVCGRREHNGRACCAERLLCSQ